MNLHKHQLG